MVLIGEAPGENEDIEGIPFCGRAGKFLTWGLESAGIKRSSIYLTNTILCRPPSNDIESAEAIEAARCCRAGFEDELEYFKRAGVKVVVPLGGQAFHSMGLEGSPTRVRGSVYQARGFTVVPTFHPSFVMRSQHKKEGTEVTYKYIWIADLAKAKGLVEKDWKPPVERFTLSPNVRDVEDFLGEAVRNRRLLGVDIETTGRGDRCSVVVVGISTSGEDAISIPFLRKGNVPYWVGADEIRVREALNKAFKACPLMFQNALFDVPILKEAGFEIDFDRVQEDTMLLHHAVSPELPHNLGFIVSVYGETPFWKDIFSERRVSILEMPEDALWTYNLRDAVVLHQVLPGLLADLREIGGEDCYRKESLALLGAVSEMSRTGFRVDGSKLRALKDRWTRELEELETAVRSFYDLPETFNLDSGDDLRWFIFGKEAAKFKKLEALKEYDASTMTGKRARKKGTKAWQNLTAIAEVKALKQPYTLASWHARKTKTDLVAVDKQGLLAYQIQLQNRLKEVRDYKHDKFKTEARDIARLLEWLKIYRDFATLSKLTSTYTNYPTDSNNRVHSSFLIHGTATGRLSSRDPNLQNLPKKRPEARGPFVASDGHVLVSADYSNLEVRVLAYETGDEALIKALESGIKIHDENTNTLFNLKHGDEMFELGKRAAKIFMFGGISYGGSDMEIHSKIAMEVPQLALTMADYKKARNNWLAKYTSYRAWAERVRTEVHKTHQSRTFGGRVRTLHGSGSSIEKAALNTPMQGGAANIINQAVIRIHERKRSLKSKLIAQVHDQLIYEVLLSEVDLMTKIIREEMERPVDYRGRLVSFPVDISTGTSWGDLKEVEDDGDSDPEGI